MADYQIKLTPIDTFFFGGEKHTKNGDDKLVANYFVESNPYPQQTTLLGLLRYYLLVKNNHLFDGKQIIKGKKEEIQELIGPKGFDYNDELKNDEDDPQDEGYGKIKSLSPLYLCHNEEKYLFAPMDYGFDMKDDYQLIRDGINYNAKKHYGHIGKYLVTSSGKKININKIIEPVEQVGNEKAENGENRDEKFYKQISMRMKPGWSFCVDTEIEAGAGIESEGDSLFLPFGGEKSFFRAEVVNLNKKPLPPSLPANYLRPVPYLYCLSDCFIESNIVKNCRFAVNSHVSFRNMLSHVRKTTKYSGLSEKDEKQLKRSNRFNLLQRGSVLYFEDVTSLNNAVSNIENNKCNTIGFNQILTSLKSN